MHYRVVSIHVLYSIALSPAVLHEPMESLFIMEKWHCFFATVNVPIGSYKLLIECATLLKLFKLFANFGYNENLYKQR